ncbi:MAG TPA: undecaprenyl-diphosphate phosphatase [Candidatus Babeliales bacterium]|nr:undecaprenyl-diphosphate phosphatase [Candidatus Babeliales bacterium]
MILGFLIISFCAVLLEMLPISSSTHIAMLTNELQAHGFFIYNEELLKALDFLLHGPTVIVLILFFFNRWKLLPYYFLKNRYSFLNYLICGFIAELVTLLFFIFFEYTGMSWWPRWIGFLLTAVALLSDRLLGPQEESVAWNKINAFALGVAQGIAFLPGVSRFGLTFAAARWCGFSLRHAFELSFLIEFPISCAATVKGFYDMHKLHALNLLNWQWQLTMVIAIVVAVALLFLIRKIIMARKWWLFGWYAAILAAVTWLDDHP